MNITKIEQNLDGTLLMLTKFGSHLYGTDTPESDLDYKGVYMPSVKQICLGNIPKSVRLDTNPSNEKNSNEDIDIEIYSLHYFLKLACKGETAALDMLHTNKECLIKTSEAWAITVSCRDLFYTKNLKAFVSYARKQAAKYGVKGSRLDAARELIELLRDKPDTMKLKEFWTELPINEHAQFIDTSPQGIRQYQVCGKVLQETQCALYTFNMIVNFHNKYGARAKLASENKGVDWKAMSHAIRAAVQVRQILKEGTITFPLKEANFLMNVKTGNLDFALVLSYLEDMMAEVEELTLLSTLREEVNVEDWDEFLFMQVHKHITGKLP